MSVARPRMVFVSPLFLFPTDSGGKIRTTNILRGLKGGAFEVTLMSPARGEQVERWRAEIDTLCDRYVPWPAGRSKARWQRALDLLGDTPVNVAVDRTPQGLAAVRAMADSGEVDVMVFDFVHASVLRPIRMAFPAICFTHNVEAEIFARHAQESRHRLWRRVWSSQHAKMVRFESAALRGYEKVIAVSERDASQFHRSYGVASAEAIPTGVDLDHFSWQLPPDPGPERPPTVVFTGAMDSPANIDGVRFFLDEIWPRVATELPQARFVVVGKHPPAALVSQARRWPTVEFTGLVDDVRPHIRVAQVSVIPLRVGGGTRIKAFEAMAIGSPVVSTAVGIEGLDVQVGTHFLASDDPTGFAGAVLHLLRDSAARRRLSRAARALVEARFGHRVASQAFEDICLRTLKQAPSA